MTTHTTYTPHTFTPLNSGWTFTALNPELAPEALRDRLTAGIPATVPGEATIDLLDAGLIEDPFDGDNENRQQWIGDIDWRFTCEFDWHNDGNDRHDLVAYGLDTVAYVSLNGLIVGNTRNFHRTYRWDARPYLRDGKNTLSVVFMYPCAFPRPKNSDVATIHTPSITPSTRFVSPATPSGGIGASTWPTPESGVR